MNDTLIKMDNLSIGYNGRPVVSGISLSIARNTFTAILGPNGSGKSTLLKTILGLIPKVDGSMVMASTGSPLVFGYVPQSIQLDSIYLFTGFDVALMGTYGRVRPGRKVSAAERAHVHECLNAAGAEEFAHQQFSELSGGQKQRVLIARALVTRPDVLVLDEPTSGVDREATNAILEFIVQIRREKKIAVLLVTHDSAVARRYAERVVWFHEGKILQGDAAELLTPERMAEIFEMRMD